MLIDQNTRLNGSAKLKNVDISDSGKRIVVVIESNTIGGTLSLELTAKEADKLSREIAALLVPA